MGRRPSMVYWLTLMVILVSAGFSSVQDLLRQPGVGGCEYCATVARAPQWLPPVGLMLPSILLDLAPATLMPLFSPVLTSLPPSPAGVAQTGPSVPLNPA